MTTVHLAPTDLKPYYLRDSDGVYTGDEYRTAAAAASAAADRPGTTVHRDLYVAENPTTWSFSGPHIAFAPAPPPIKPRWAAHAWGDLD